MARREGNGTPTITSGVLYTDDPASGASVGSLQWFAWLETASAFYYDHPDNPFTARAERKQRGGVYWLAYRRVSGKLYKAYLGKAEALTADKLADTARQLAERAALVKLPGQKSTSNLIRVQAEPDAVKAVKQPIQDVIAPNTNKHPRKGTKHA